MRHRLAHRKLGRTSDHRRALLRNQAEALLQHERIVTTVPKAKELRPFVERLITVAKRGVKAAEPKGRTLAAKRLVQKDLLSHAVLDKLFAELAPRFMERPGGYTRILKLGHRPGDGADVARIELLAE
jgi:large subunit ribosomal protein L17